MDAPHMLKLILRRVALTVPTFVALMFVTFVAVRLVPGDPIEARTGERGIDPERLAALRHELGLDQPVWKQFLDYVYALLHGDFGVSIVTKTPGAARIPHPVPGDAGTRALRPRLRRGARRARRRAGGSEAWLGAGPFGDGGWRWRAIPCPSSGGGLLLIMFMSEYLGLTPVSGRMDLINYYFEPVTGFMLIDSLLSGETAPSARRWRISSCPPSCSAPFRWR